MLQEALFHAEWLFFSISNAQAIHIILLLQKLCSYKKSRETLISLPIDMLLCCIAVAKIRLSACLRFNAQMWCAAAKHNALFAIIILFPGYLLFFPAAFKRKVFHYHPKR